MNRITTLCMVSAVALLLGGCAGNAADNGTTDGNGNGTANSTGSTSRGNAPKTDTALSKEDAVNIALGHASLTQDQVAFIKSELDRDIDGDHYDIEFFTKDYKEYDYEIDPYTGEILDMDFDIENYPPVSEYVD